MIRIYWPGKAVPEWLERISFSGDCNGGVPCARHAGFGVIARWKGMFHVFPLFGTFIHIDAAGMHVTIEGQQGGVFYHGRCLVRRLPRSPR